MCDLFFLDILGIVTNYNQNHFRFLTSIQQALGPAAAMTVRNIEVDIMPVLMIIMRSRSNTDIFTIVFGNVGVNELLTNLIEAVDVFQVNFYFITNCKTI